MAAPLSKCDVVRAALAAAACGACAAYAEGDPAPAGCGSPPPPAALCALAGGANARLEADALALSLRGRFGGVAARVRAAEENAYAADVQAAAAGIADAFPGADNDVTWVDAARCLVVADGSPGGVGAPHRRFSRADAEALGFSPPHPLGGGAFAGAVWAPPRTSPLPLTVDYLANPDFFVLLALAAALAAAAAAARRARRGRGPRDKKTGRGV